MRRLPAPEARTQRQLGSAARGAAPRAASPRPRAASFRTSRAERGRPSIKLGPRVYPSDRELLFVGTGIEDGEKRLLRNVDAADRLHALLAFLLLGPQFSLARDVAAVTFGGHVLAHG